MKRLRFLLIASLGLLPVLLAAQNTSTPEKCVPCESLLKLKFPDVKISEAVTVTAKSTYCKVTGIIGKEINFEVLLPFEWNNIFIMGGGGGFVGIIQNSCQFYH